MAVLSNVSSEFLMDWEEELPAEDFETTCLTLSDEDDNNLDTMVIDPEPFVYFGTQQSDAAPEDPQERILWYEERLERMVHQLGGCIVQQQGIGACQFLAIADGAQNHSDLRQAVVDHMQSNTEHREFYAPDGPDEPDTYDEYLEKMRLPTTYGDEYTMVAAAEVLRTGICTLDARSGELVVIQPQQPTEKMVCLTYRPEHYDKLSVPCAVLDVLRGLHGRFPVASFAEEFLGVAPDDDVPKAADDCSPNPKTLVKKVRPLPKEALRRKREHTVEEKLWIIALSEAGASTKELSRRFGFSDTKSVLAILSQKEKYNSLTVDSSVNTRKRKRADGGGRKPAFGDAEERAARAIRELRDKKESVPKGRCKQILQDEIRKEEKGTTTLVSEKLYSGFLKRQKLSEKKVTRRSTKTVEERRSFAARFFRYIHSLHALWPDLVVVNYDESPITPLGRSVERVVGPVGEQPDVTLPCVTSQDTHRMASAVMGVSSCNPQPPQVLLIKKSNPPKPAERALYPKDLVVTSNDTGISNTDFFCNTFVPLMNDYLPEKKKLLILDSAKSHISRLSLSTLRRNGHLVAIIPGGLTSDLQFMDVFYFGLFKKHFDTMGAKWFEKATKKMTAAERRVNVALWLAEAHKQTLQTLDIPRLMQKIGYLKTSIKTYFFNTSRTLGQLRVDMRELDPAVVQLHERECVGETKKDPSEQKPVEVTTVVTKRSGSKRYICDVCKSYSTAWLRNYNDHKKGCKPTKSLLSYFNPKN